MNIHQWTFVNLSQGSGPEPKVLGRFVDTCSLQAPPGRTWMGCRCGFRGEGEAGEGSVDAQGWGGGGGSHQTETTHFCWINQDSASGQMGMDTAQRPSGKFQAPSARRWGQTVPREALNWSSSVTSPVCPPTQTSVSLYENRCIAQFNASPEINCNPQATAPFYR